MASPARSSLLRTKAWIGGKWRAALSENTFPVYNPANNELIAEVPDMGAEDVDVAVQDAYANQKLWAAATVKERSSVLWKLNDLMLANKQDLGHIIILSLETGKPFQEAMGEVAYAASFFEWFSEQVKRLDGDILAPPKRGQRVLITRQPVGVAALITPWNFPIAMVARKASAALAAGCATVLKPSEETPLSALALAELSQQAGVPAGVLNVVTGSRQSAVAIGDALSTNELVTAVSFTGSTGVGKLLMRQCADTVKKVSLELGGNAPLIVFNSADIQNAVQGTMFSKFRNTGQTCISCNRILVQSGIHDEFVDALRRSIEGLKQGGPFEDGVNVGPLIHEAAVSKHPLPMPSPPSVSVFDKDGVNVGPLIHEAAVSKVADHVTDATSKGAEAIVGGARNDDLGPCYYRPSLLVGANTEMTLAHEETFGPIAPVIKFEEEEEAISVANATPFGLASYFFSRDMSQIWRVSEALDTGIVGVNEGAVSSEMVPFGGFKQSGLGREGSKYGMEEYLEMKYMCLGGVEERL